MFSAMLDPGPCKGCPLLAIMEVVTCVICLPNLCFRNGSELYHHIDRAPYISSDQFEKLLRHQMQRQTRPEMYQHLW